MLSITKAELSLADAYKRKGVYLPFFSKKKKKKKKNAKNSLCLQEDLMQLCLKIREIATKNVSSIKSLLGTHMLLVVSI